MTNLLSSFDVIVVKFPFASSLKYKARPAVVISKDEYNKYSRQSFIILAISSQVETKLDFEPSLQDWSEAGLLKPSVFKASIATIDKESIVARLGRLSDNDEKKLKDLLKTILVD